MPSSRMPLSLYNSLTKSKEVFEPLEPGHVRCYVCGPTVYDVPHLGHLRAAYAFEMIRNYLKYSGFKVTFVRNVTDVDDKIIEKAKSSGGEDLVAQTREVSRRYYEAYRQLLDGFGIAAPTHEPFATEHIKEMQALIQSLIARGHAYESGGDVYYDVRRFEAYGKLSHQNKEAMLESVRIEANDKKRDPLDFALWKRSKSGEPSWPSPWGEGRPGWHIECSAMSMKYLGETFDIHAGGRDLIFPHHENEIAQSEAATGKRYARYWLHNGLVTNQSQKMSKSLGNFVTLDEILSREGFTKDDIKLLFLSTHYRAPLDYTEDKMRMERSVRERFYFFLEDADKLSAEVSAKPDPRVSAYRAQFMEAMDDDLNTPKAFSVLHEWMHEARKVAAKEPGFVKATASKLREIGAIFGLFGAEEVAHTLHSLHGITAHEIDQAIAARQKAKAAKDYKTADEIRQRLQERGIELLDLSGGKTGWRKA